MKFNYLTYTALALLLSSASARVGTIRDIDKDEDKTGTNDDESIVNENVVDSELLETLTLHKEDVGPDDLEHVELVLPQVTLQFRSDPHAAAAVEEDGDERKLVETDEDEDDRKLCGDAMVLSIAHTVGMTMSGLDVVVMSGGGSRHVVTAITTLAARRATTPVGRHDMMHAYALYLLLICTALFCS